MNGDSMRTCEWLLQVKSGMLVAPGIPTPVELQEMQEIVGTFGEASQSHTVNSYNLFQQAQAELDVAWHSKGTPQRLCHAEDLEFICNWPLNSN